MFIPRKGTSGRIVVDTIHEHGPMTFEQGLQAHKILGMYLSRTREVYKRSLKSGWIVEQDGVYSLSPEMKAYLDSCEEDTEEKARITPAATPPQFRPLSLKYIPSAQARRFDAGPARDMHFFYGTPAAELIYGTVVKESHAE